MRELLERLTRQEPLQEFLASLVRWVESRCPGGGCAVSLVEADGRTVSEVVAPQLTPQSLASGPVGSSVIRGVGGRVLGSLGVYRLSPGQPPPLVPEGLDEAALLAGVAIERSRSDLALQVSESRFRSLYGKVLEGVYQSAIDGAILSANPALVRMLGYDTAEELYALPSAAAMYWNPEERADFVRNVVQQGEVHNVEFELRRRDGQQLIVLESASAVRDAAGRVVAFAGTLSNITERKRAERQVLEEKNRAQVTLQCIGDAVISTDAVGVIDYLNPVAERLTGWTLAEALGSHLDTVLHLVDEASRDDLESPLLRCLREGVSVGLPCDTVLLGRTGEETAVHASAAPLLSRDGRSMGAVTVFRDVTQERRQQHELSYQASHDVLTGLVNRRAFNEQLQRAVDGARRGTGEHVLLYIDLDQFKAVNDSCGHPAGDQLLVDVTALLQARVRSVDTVARLGGDEFAILLKGCPLERARKIAESIRLAVKDYQFVWKEASLGIGASIGLATVTQATESMASLLSAADIACYAAKQAGRNRVHIYVQPD